MAAEGTRATPGGRRVTAAASNAVPDKVRAAAAVGARVLASVPSQWIVA